MNRGYKNYISDSCSIVNNTIYLNIKNVLKYYFIMIMQSLLIYIPIINYVSIFANIKFTENICKNRKVSILDSLENVEEPKRIWTTFLFSLIKGAVLGVVIVPLYIIMITFMVLTSGSIDNSMLVDVEKYLIPLVIALWLVLILVVVLYIVVESFTYPAVYLLSKNSKLSLKNTIKQSINCSKEGIKTFWGILLTYFGIAFLVYLFFIFSLVIILISKTTFYIFVGWVLLSIIIILIVIFLPFYVSTCQCAIYLLVEDISISNSKDIDEVVSEEEISIQKLEKFLGV